jgi:hypothetical protein
MIDGSLPPVSNRADWPDSHAFYITDDEDGTEIDLTTATEITLQIARDYRCSPSLSARLSQGTIEIDGATFSPTFTASQMGALCAGTYEVGITVVVDGKTIQLFAGSLPVIDGIVR